VQAVNMVRMDSLIPVTAQACQELTGGIADSAWFVQPIGVILAADP
jgi:hypothetical protein